MKKISENKNSDSAASKIYAFILFCFFISGLTGLVYEIIWTRLIVKIIGSAPFAVSIVVTVFMAGLGLGSYLAGRTIDRVENPQHLVKLYGILELFIGVYGLILPSFLKISIPFYALIYNQLFKHFILYNFITFLGCSILLILPVTCMGATLPILSRFYITKISHTGSHLGKLYGLNTIGAAFGSLLCGFWIINAWGVQGSLIFAVIINIFIGISCLLVSRSVKPAPMNLESIAIKKSHLKNFQAPDLSCQGSVRSADLHALDSNKHNTFHSGVREKGLFHRPQKSHLLNCTIPKNAGLYQSGALIIIAVSGFCTMAYEVILTGLLGLIVGPTTYSFTIVLTTFITSLAFGSIFFGWLADRTKRTFDLLLYTQIIAAIFVICISHILGNSQIFFAKLIFYFKDNFAFLTLLKSIILFIFMFFPTFFLGASFPLVVKIYTQSLSHVGKSVGFAYSINTAGAVMGSFCAGFVLMPLVGKEKGLNLIVTIQIITSLGIGSLIYFKLKKSVSEFYIFILLAMVGIILLFSYPRWDRKMLSKGKYHRYEEPDKLRNTGWLRTLFYGAKMFAEYDKSRLVYYGDGIGGLITVIKDSNVSGRLKYYIYNSGKPDASSDVDDMWTQTLSAHFPLLFHKNPGKVMVLGLATGITAGEVLNYPIENLDVIDINSQMVFASNYFIPFNNDVLVNPKTELIIQDGRAHVGLTGRKYDVIISEPSNPWMAGLSSLFTYEFFDLVRNRLNEDGIFAQWVHSYQMDWFNFALIGRTFSKVFPNSILVNLNPNVSSNDFLLVGFNGEKKLNMDTVEKNLYYANKSRNFNLIDNRLIFKLIVSENLENLFGPGPINKDNYPKLEFSAPKLLHTYDKTIKENIMKN